MLTDKDINSLLKEPEEPAAGVINNESLEDKIIESFNNKLEELTNEYEKKFNDLNVGNVENEIKEDNQEVKENE